MLRPMSLAQQWEHIRSGLPADWGTVRIALRLADESEAVRAAALLGALAPGRAGRELHLTSSRRGGRGPAPSAVARALAKLDSERIRGDLAPLGAADVPGTEEPSRRPDLAESWDAALGELPPDWSDVYGEIELTSSDHLDPAALALAPVNPARYAETPGFRFRCARRFGYGASPEMVRRCLERLDEQGIPGRVRIVHALSDTKPVGTQGPVWYAGGKVI